MTVYEMEKYGERGECVCKRCIDALDGAQPEGHTADLVFFKVALRQPPISKETFEQTLREHRGEFASCNPFDGEQHNYIEIGAWIGDQGAALKIMGMGALLGSWDLLTPYTVHSFKPGDPEALNMAENGFVLIQAKK